MVNRTAEIKGLTELIKHRRFAYRQRGKMHILEFLPQTAAEIETILKYANIEKKPVFQSTTGFELDSLHESMIDFQGELLAINTGEMNKIIEVNEYSRYAVVEPGVTQKRLAEYLERHHPGVHHCLVPVFGNDKILYNVYEGLSNECSTRYGYTRNMIQGLEIVLPFGILTKMGSCSVSPLWFSSGPLPEIKDYIIQTGEAGGFITKISLQLYPKTQHREMVVFIIKEPNDIAQTIGEITHCELADQVTVIRKNSPSYLKNIIVVSISLSALSIKELEMKKNILEALFAENNKVMFKKGLSKEMLQSLLPSHLADNEAGEEKNAAFDFLISMQNIFQVWQQTSELSKSCNVTPEYRFVVLDHGHEVLGSISFIIPKVKGSPGSEKLLFDGIWHIITSFGGIPHGLKKKRGPSGVPDNLRNAIDPGKIMLN